MVTVKYDRMRATEYCGRWALSRNPSYYNFDPIGGDCTNFVSQCIHAGSGIMNYTPINGWYYNGASDRTASWTGVQYLYRFLVNNSGLGPFASVTDYNGVTIGDIVQLGRADGSFYHTLFISGIKNGRLLVSAHSTDYYNRPLDSYSFSKIRYLKIDGVRKW